MLEIYLTENKDVHGKVETLIAQKLGKDFEIKRTESGKPYIVGNPLYFSLSHSSAHAMIALCDKPVGIDFESTGKQRNITHVLSHFTEREQSYINGNYELFLLNWVSKEAFVKMKGGTLAHYLKRLKFYDNCLFLDDEKINYLANARLPEGIYAVCAEGCELSHLKIQLI